MAHDEVDDDGPLWSMLWRIEELATALHEQVDGLLDDDELLLDDDAVHLEESSSAPIPNYYSERYGDDEPAREYRRSTTDAQPEYRQFDGGRRPFPDDSDVGSSSRGLRRQPPPTSFRARMSEHRQDERDTGSVTNSFRNAVYGIEDPDSRESLRSLLERRAFDELWVQGAYSDGDRFIEFFESEGFGPRS